MNRPSNYLGTYLTKTSGIKWDLINNTPVIGQKINENSVLGSKNYSTTTSEISKSNYGSLALKTEISMWRERWFLSCNAKDIGTLYLMFAVFSGLAGTAFSVLIRLELSGPGVQFIADNQLYNSIITAHAIMMIFFMDKEQKRDKIILYLK